MTRPTLLAAAILAVLALLPAALSSAPAAAASAASAIPDFAHALPSWLRAHGASVAPVTVGSASGAVFDAADTTFARPGLWAETDLLAGAIVAELPSSLFLYSDSSFAPASSSSAAAAAADWSPAEGSSAAHMAALLASLGGTNVTDPLALLATRVLYEHAHSVNNNNKKKKGTTGATTPTAAFSPFMSSLAPAPAGHVALTPSDLAALHLSPASARSSPLAAVSAEHTALCARMATVLRSLVTPDLSNELLAELRNDPDTAAALAAAGLAGDGAAATPEAVAAALGAGRIEETPYARALPHGPEGLAPEAFTRAYAQTLASAVALPPRHRRRRHRHSSSQSKTDRAEDHTEDEWEWGMVPLLTVVNHVASLSTPLEPRAVTAATATALNVVIDDDVNTAAKGYLAKGKGAASRDGPSAEIRVIPVQTRKAATATETETETVEYKVVLVAKRDIPVGAQITVDYGQFMRSPLEDESTSNNGNNSTEAKANALLISGKSTLPLDSDGVNASNTDADYYYPLPAIPVSNPLLLIHFGAALPANPHEGVLLQAAVTAAGDDEATNSTPTPPNGKPPAAMSAEAKLDEKERVALLTRLLSVNAFPSAASLTLASPLRSRSQKEFMQALRAAQLSLPELQSLESMLELRFDADKGYFSLHNELATALGAFGSMEEALAGSTAAFEDDASEWALVVKKLGRTAAEAHKARLLLSHSQSANANTAANAAAAANANANVEALLASLEGSLALLQEQTWEAQRVASRLATARAVRSVALDALAAVADVFADLSGRWRRDARALAGDAEAPQDVRAAAARWEAEVAGWEAEAGAWAQGHAKWGKELVEVMVPK